MLSAGGGQGPVPTLTRRRGLRFPFAWRRAIGRCALLTSARTASTWWSASAATPRLPRMSRRAGKSAVRRAEAAHARDWRTGSAPAGRRAHRRSRSGTPLPGSRVVQHAAAARAGPGSTARAARAEAGGIVRSRPRAAGATGLRRTAGARRLNEAFAEAWSSVTAARVAAAARRGGAR